MDENRIKGGLKEMHGSVKASAGKLTGNDQLIAEGRAERAEGKIQAAVGRVKDAVKGILKRDS